MAPRIGSLWDAVGNTPLLRIGSLSRLTGCEILGKAEFMNPGGSHQGPRRQGHHPPRRAGAASSRPAAPSSRAPPATPASAWGCSGASAATASSSPCRTTRPARSTSYLEAMGVEVRKVPAVPVLQPRATSSTPRRVLCRGERLVLGQPVREHRQRRLPLRDHRPRALGAVRGQAGRARRSRWAAAARCPASTPLPQGEEPRACAW